MDELLRRGWLEETSSPSDVRRVYFHLAKAGFSALSDRGVALPVTTAGKPVAFACLDWTERRWHLGGALGRAVVTALVDAGCIRRTSESRVVNVLGDLGQWLESS